MNVELKSILAEMQSKLKENLNELYLSKKFADFDVIIIEDDKKQILKAHKFILSARNEVFAEMFDNAKTDSIHIFDVSFETFNHFLEYLYFGKTDETYINLELFVVADKYCDKELKSICEIYLSTKITTENVIMSLLTAVKHNSILLTCETARFIVENFPNIQNLPDYKLIHQDKVAVKVIFQHFHEISLTKKNVFTEQFELQLQSQTGTPGSLQSVKKEIPITSQFLNSTWTFSYEISTVDSNLYLTLTTKTIFGQLFADITYTIESSNNENNNFVRKQRILLHRNNTFQISTSELSNILQYSHNASHNGYRIKVYTIKLKVSIQTMHYCYTPNF